MSTAVPPSPHVGAQLLAALEQTGPRPALAWYGEAARIELSGHVLANWVIKSIGHLHDEIDLAPGDEVVLDLPPHWKRLALALASWSLGAEVTVLERSAEGAATAGSEVGVAAEAAVAPEAGSEAGAAVGPEAGSEAGAASPRLPDAPRVVVTDRPDTALAESADEVLALEAVSLAPRYSGELPPLVHDWLSEVRGSSDLLGVALPAWSGPAPASATAVGVGVGVGVGPDQRGRPSSAGRGRRARHGPRDARRVPGRRRDRQPRLSPHRPSGGGGRRHRHPLTPGLSDDHASTR